jgi:hypothetical protein
VLDWHSLGTKSVKPIQIVPNRISYAGGFNKFPHR